MVSAFCKALEDACSPAAGPVNRSVSGDEGAFSAEFCSAGAGKTSATTSYS